MTQNPNQLGDSVIFMLSFPSHIFMYGCYVCFSFCYVFGGFDSLQTVREVFCCLSPLLFSLEHVPKKSVQKR